MTETVEGRKSPVGGIVDDFKALNMKQWVSILLALVVSVILQIYGLGFGCLMFLIIAVILYMFPHLTGVSSVKIKAIVGILFIIITIPIGTFAFGDNVDALEDNVDNDYEYIRDVSFDPETGVLEFDSIPAVTIGEQYPNNEWNVIVTSYPLMSIAFGYPVYEAANTSEETITSAGTLLEDGWYHFVYNVDVSDGSALGIEIESSVTYPNEDNDSVKTGQAMTFIDLNGESRTNLCFIGSAYYVAYSIVLFFIILIFSALMRRSVEKTRTKMEEEGRLYPQGYGRCKECGAMVLPGEVNCRKCGAYIDVPDEMRVHKKDYFQCSECGAEVPADATECPRCGAKFDETQENIVVHEDGTEDVSTENVVCPECGASVPANADWCPRCGKMLKKE